MMAYEDFGSSSQLPRGHFAPAFAKEDTPRQPIYSQVASPPRVVGMGEYAGRLAERFRSRIRRQIHIAALPPRVPVNARIVPVEELHVGISVSLLYADQNLFVG